MRVSLRALEVLMAVEDPPGVLNSDTTPSKVQRHTTQGLLGVPVGAFAGGVGATAGGGHGVVGSGDLLVTQSAAPAMSVDVAKGIAFVVGTVSAEQGPYSFYNDATVTLAISAAHATLSRRDLIVAQIQDADYSGAVRSARLLVVTGTAGSGVDPSLSGTPNALVLARVTVPAAAASILNANITDLRSRASALNGVRVFADAASRDAALGTTAKGALAYVLDTALLTICNGTAWSDIEGAVPWINVSFSNGWVNAAGWQAVQYRKVGDVVQLRGHLASGTGGATAFTLPAGYRPPAVMQFPAGVTAGSITVNTNGTVVPPTNAHYSLFISFSVTP